MNRVLVIGVLLTTLARAETNLLTLAGAKRIAFARNWDLLAAKSDVDLATAQTIIAHEFPNPTLSLSTAKISVDNHSNATSLGNGLGDRSYDTILAINQLFEIGGKRPARQASAQAGHEAARARLADARRTLDAAVTKAYVTAALADANVRILTESASYLRKEADIGAIRLNAGDISRSDLDQLEIAAAQDELNARNAAATAVQQRIVLEVLLGMTQPKGTVLVIDSLDELANAPLPAGETAGAQRPDLLAAEAALRQAESELRLQKAIRIPDPTISLQYEHNPPDTPNTVGLGVSFPLPLWNRNGGAIHAAEATRDQATLTVERTRAQIISDIATAQSAYDEATVRLRNYRQNLQPKAKRVRQTVSLAYEKGGATLLDLLEAQRNDNTIRLAAAQAAADTAGAAATLAAALTKISPSELTRKTP